MQCMSVSNSAVKYCNVNHTTVNTVCTCICIVFVVLEYGIWSFWCPIQSFCFSLYGIWNLPSTSWGPQIAQYLQHFMLWWVYIKIILPLYEWGLYCNHLVRPSVCLSVHTFVIDISASTGRNDFIFDIWLWHGDLYRVSPFQVYRTSTSCLPCDLQMNEWGYS